MEFDLHPTVTLRTGTFAALLAPEDLVLAGLNDNPVLRRFLFLFVSGNYSRLLSGINRRSVTIEVRRAFTAFQLLTILRDLRSRFAVGDAKKSRSKRKALGRSLSRRVFCVSCHGYDGRCLVSPYLLFPTGRYQS